MLGMPWTIPNLLLHAKPVPLANMRSLGRTHVFVYCSNPDCHHNAELDASDFPRRDHLERSAAAHGLHGLRPSRRRRKAVMALTMKCTLCEDCGWVSESHPDRPWNGEHACNAAPLARHVRDAIQAVRTIRRDRQELSGLNSTREAGAIEWLAAGL
jgi:hypothetical protein